MSLGFKTLETLADQLDPQQLIQKASQLISTELRESIKKVLQDPEAAPLQDLIDQLYEELDTDRIISAITTPLANQLSDWFKEQPDDLIAAIVDAIDFEEVMELVAEKVAHRIQLNQ